MLSCLLKDDLKDIILPGSSILVQYVDDLLLASKTYKDWLKDTICLCTALAEKAVSAGSKIFRIHINRRTKISRPRMGPGYCRNTSTGNKQLRGFLGAVGYCISWILGLRELSKPLRDTTKAEEVQPIQWGPEREKACQAIKGVLAPAPALGFLDYSKFFELFVHENKGVASGLGPHHHPVAYYSTHLDPVAAGNHSCVKAIAATVTIIEKSRPLVLRHPTTVYVPHEVELILKQHATQALSPQRAHHYELTILYADNITLKRCNVLNPAALLPVPSDAAICAKLVFHSSRLWGDLRDHPLENSALTVFTDGSSYYMNEKRHTDYAVVRNLEVPKAEPLQPSVSAQEAELTALARAVWWGPNERVTIYTDSKYGFGMYHATSMIWKEREFLTLVEKNISNGTEI
ncbi:LOW QUALITY PROTEIN: hypothetical protein QYF61_003355 [Mycteria americana]|uniref:RNase H type-1 domain-containing protein n=1 Tax=Mycteria americana TaxID=33587 RepID=A0AAN7MMW5_MYCAM|nr:LOW QUALITY PROTEIN: hypothetical protein QYF61_003355 [Mycteria americana]